MSLLPVPMEVTSLNLSGVNLTFVAVVGVIALIALVMAMIFRREVLAANDGTPNMQSIARAVQEGASAYLGRQFRTLSVFAVAAFFLLLLLPVHASADFSSLTLRFSRSVAFLAGAGCGSKTYPVEGKVVWLDDKSATELAGGSVTFTSEEARTSAGGEIDAEGNFRLSTFQ